MRDAIDACNYLYLRGIEEPEENTLRVVVEEAKPVRDRPADTGNETLDKALAGAQVIDSDDSCQVFELVWPSYIAYAVRNESYTSWDDAESWEGRLFREYDKSHFRDYITRGTFATDEYPGPLRHWCLICLRHIVDVVSNVEPELRRLRPG